MMKSAFWRVSALALVAVLVLPTIVPGLAQATDAKHTALNGSLQHPTSAELNAYAHKAANMEGFVEITTGPYPTSSASSLGSGRILFGLNDDLSIHMQANDGAFPARGIDYMWGGTSLSSAGIFSMSTPAQILEADLIGGGDDGALAWSAGVSLAQSKDESTFNDGSGETQDDDNTTGFALRGSAGSDNWDAGGEFAMISNTDEETGRTPEEKIESDETAFGIWGQLHREDWQFIGAFASRSSDDGDDTGTPDDPSAFAFLAEAGYHFRNDEEGHVTGEIHIEYMKENDLFDGSYFSDVTAIYLPGCGVAVDQNIAGPLRVYIGADAAWVMVKDDMTDAADDTITEEIKGSFFQWDWSIGLGLDVHDDVELDFVLNPNNLDHLLSIGNDDPMIWQFSANVTH